MDCNCFKEYKFHITNGSDCKSFIYTDLSAWINTPINYTVDVRIPTDTVSRSVVVLANNTTIIDSEVLGITNSGSDLFTLPDGIYTFTTQNCKGTYTDKVLNLCSLKAKLNQHVASVDVCPDCNNELIKSCLIRAYTSILSAEAMFNSCKDNVVPIINELINYAKSILDDYSKCSC